MFATGRRGGERGLARLGELASFALVVGLEQQPGVVEDPQHARLADPVSTVAGGGPDLAVPPGGMLHRDSDDHLPVGEADRRRPRALRWVTCAGLGLPAPVGPFRDADQLAEPRGRHPGLAADYLEVLEGPSRPSALFFQTRSSTAASPRPG